MNTSALLAVLVDVRVLLAQPENDFSWSSFMDMEIALSEIDGISARVRAGGPVPLMLSVLFAATGPIQEVALSSGWGDEFIALAHRFDAAMAGNASTPGPPGVPPSVDGGRTQHRE